MILARLYSGNVPQPELQLDISFGTRPKANTYFSKFRDEGTVLPERGGSGQLEHHEAHQRGHAAVNGQCESFVLEWLDH